MIDELGISSDDIEKHWKLLERGKIMMDDDDYEIFKRYSFMALIGLAIGMILGGVVSLLLN